MQGLNILVCEDERLFALELTDRLAKLGHRTVAVASDAAEAYEAARAFSPDLALMDIRLEGSVPGTEIAERLNREFEIPSIYLTAYSDDRVLSAAHKSEPLGYLTKPVRDSDLKNAIDFGYARYKTQRALEQELDKALTAAADDGPDVPPASPKFQNRMELVNHSVGTMASHMRDGLWVVYNYLNWLADCGTLSEFEERQVRGALAACDMQDTLLQRVLWASQRGGKALAIVSLSEIVPRIIERLRAVIPSTVRLDWRSDDDNRLVYIDERAVTEAITEVIMNAIEATRGTGTVTVTLSQTVEDAPVAYNARALPGPYHVLSVTDSGEGPPNEVGSRIFEPFFTTRTERRAPGLGLAVTYGVMQAHSGWAKIAKNEGGGATMSLYFPADCRSSEN